MNFFDIWSLAEPQNLKLYTQTLSVSNQLLDVTAHQALAFVEKYLPRIPMDVNQ